MSPNSHRGPEAAGWISRCNVLWNTTEKNKTKRKDKSHQQPFFPVYFLSPPLWIIFLTIQWLQSRFWHISHLSWCTLSSIHWRPFFCFTEVLVVRVAAPQLLARVIGSKLSEETAIQNLSYSAQTQRCVNTVIHLALSHHRRKNLRRGVCLNLKWCVFSGVSSPLSLERHMIILLEQHL